MKEDSRSEANFEPNQEYVFNPAIPGEPYWKNGYRRCDYVSAVGLPLGHVSLGEGASRFMWFSFTAQNESCIMASGLSDREKAKTLVESTLEADWECEVALNFDALQTKEENQ